MTKAAALYEFFNSFGVPAYPSNAVPDDVAFPWITYEAMMSNWYGQQTVYPAVNIWYKTESEAVINAKAEEISKAIGGGTTIPCDDGLIVVHFNNLWTPVNYENDSSIKRRYTTLTLDFYTL